MHALHHCGEAFQPHAGIHGRLGQGGHFPFGVTVVLHEHQVPDLDIAVAVLLGGAWGAAFYFFSVVIEDFRTGTAGASVSHAPEVVTFVGLAARLVADTAEAVGIHTNFIQPDRRCFFVLIVDGHPQFLCLQPHGLRKKLPGKTDRFPLEIIPKAEIAQHFEERMVAGRVSNIFQVVMLATSTYTTLGRCGPGIGALFLAEKHILELHHTCIGKQQCGIIGRHQRTGLDDGMSMAGKIIEECLSNFSARFHRFPVGRIQGGKW